MKKLLFVAATALTIFMMGCKGGGEPKAVLGSFFDALAKKDIAGAKKLATPESSGMLDLMQMGMAAGDSKENDKFKSGNYEIGEPTITGDKAVIAVKEKASGESTNYTLKKVDGGWKVAFDKATMTQDAADKMKGMDKMNDGDNKMDGMDSTNTNDDQMLTDTTRQ